MQRTGPITKDKQLATEGEKEHMSTEQFMGLALGMVALIVLLAVLTGGSL